MWFGMQVLRWVANFFYNWDIEVRGIENIPNENQPCVLVLNHQSKFDIFVVGFAAPKRVTIWSKKELLWLTGPFGWSIWLGNGIFVDRSNHSSARQTISITAEKIIRDRLKLFVFAEGTRNKTPEKGFLPFKKGAFAVAVNAQVPVVPIVISSLKPFVDPKRHIFERAHLIITVLPPMLPPASLKPRESAAGNGEPNASEHTASPPATSATSTSSGSGSGSGSDEFSQWVETVRARMQAVFNESSAEVLAAHAAGMRPAADAHKKAN
jgi:1-acyl-sn-glycerol-3-phosphate acyltransferase